MVLTHMPLAGHGNPRGTCMNAVCEFVSKGDTPRAPARHVAQSARSPLASYGSAGAQPRDLYQASAARYGSSAVPACPCIVSPTFD